MTRIGRNTENSQEGEAALEKLDAYLTAFLSDTKTMTLKINKKRKHSPIKKFQKFQRKKKKRVKKTMPLPSDAHDLMAIEMAFLTGPEHQDWPQLLAQCRRSIEEYIASKPDEMADILTNNVRLATIHWECNRCHEYV